MNPQSGPRVRETAADAAIEAGGFGLLYTLSLWERVGAEGYGSRCAGAHLDSLKKTGLWPGCGLQGRAPRIGTAHAPALTLALSQGERGQEGRGQEFGASRRTGQIKPERRKLTRIQIYLTTVNLHRKLRRAAFIRRLGATAV